MIVAALYGDRLHHIVELKPKPELEVEATPCSKAFGGFNEQ
jgi:hypothetical protein